MKACLLCGCTIPNANKFCSNSCRAIYLNQHSNLLRIDGKPHNYNDDKIRNCKICGTKLHHCSTTGYCAKHYREHSKWRANLIIGVKDKNGGYRPGSGHGKHGRYGGYWCDSSWELAWVIYHIEHGIQFERNHDGFEYTHENKTYRYYPDFKLESGIFIEIKGVQTNKDLSKWKVFPHELVILDSTSMKPIIEYVVQKYGKDFVKLYD